jgi:hypothetical protein
LNLPIELRIDSAGNINVSFDASFSLAWLGRFSAGTDIEVADEKTVVAIVHKVDGRTVEDRYEADGRGSEVEDGKGGGPIAVCMNGRVYGQFSEALIRIEALTDDTVITVVDPSRGSAACTDAPPTATPIPEPPEGGRSPVQVPSDKVYPAAFAVQDVYWHTTDDIGNRVNREFEFFVADTPDKRGTGMSGWEISELGDTAGMLYLYQDPQTPTSDPTDGFSLGGYFFPADIYFFDADGVLIDWFQGRTCVQGSDDCEHYEPIADYKFVIEAPVNSFLRESAGRRDARIWAEDIVTW